MKASLTSYDNPTVGSGNVVNDVQFAYNDFGQLTADYQSHSGAVNVSTTPKVQYGYASGAANTIRPTTPTYPNGRVLTFSYGTSGGISDHASRVAALIDNDGTTHLVDYDYLGRETFVVADDTQPDVKWTLADLSGSNDPDTGDIYSGLDRFGRVKDNRWYDYGASTDVDRIQYGYDRAGNRIWRENVVATSLSKAFDELYTYDAIHRLQDMQRGTLNSGHSALTSETFAQCWTLDSTGNWSGFRQDDTRDGAWDLVQARTANPVNEITDIANSVGSAWVDPAYSPAGNMTTLPQPHDPTQSYTATYDAWNRLVKLAAGANTVSEYAYDGAKRRVVQKAYSGGSLSETRQLYYTQPSQWQVVEERVGSSSNPQRQFVWGLRYIDDCVLRDRDTGGGTLDERFYACQDANWNVDALVDTAGDVQERYAYSAYGVPTFLTPGFGTRSASSYGWETLYCGYRFETATGVFHVRHRVYVAPLATWGQRDPIAYLDSPSLYCYCNLRPLAARDPFGLSWYHHWIPQGNGIPQLIQQACPGLDIHQFTTPVPGGINVNSPHWQLQYGQGLYNTKVIALITRYMSDCCNLLTRLEELINNTWSKVEWPAGVSRPQLQIGPHPSLYKGPRPPLPLGNEIQKRCNDPCRNRPGPRPNPHVNVLPNWVPKDPNNDWIQDTMISVGIAVVVVVGGLAVTGGLGGAGAAGGSAGPPILQFPATGVLPVAA